LVVQRVCLSTVTFTTATMGPQTSVTETTVTIETTGRHSFVIY